MDLYGKIALVAGATRGAGRGIAVELGAAGATVYVTGRTTRTQQSEYGRPETIEETAELVNAAGGTGIALQVDHLDPAQVQALVARIRRDAGRLDILVNDIWGGEHLFEWNKPVWEHDLENGLRLLRLAVETHLVTAHHALPLLIENAGGLLVEVAVGRRDPWPAYQNTAVSPSPARPSRFTSDSTTAERVAASSVSTSMSAPGAASRSSRSAARASATHPARGETGGG